MRMRVFLHSEKWPAMDSNTMQEVLDLCNGAVSEKSPRSFWSVLLVEYATAFSRWTDAPDVRCWLMDTHRQPNYSNPRCACVLRVNYVSHKWLLMSEASSYILPLCTYIFNQQSGEKWDRSSRLVKNVQLHTKQMLEPQRCCCMIDYDSTPPPPEWAVVSLGPSSISPDVTVKLLLV